MRGAIGTTACLGFLAAPLNGIAALQCGNCGAANIGNLTPALFPLVKKPIPYCPNCGVDLRTLKHELSCENYLRCLAKGEPVCGNGHGKYGSCFQVPFPNSKFLMRMHKPDFKIASLKF